MKTLEQGIEDLAARGLNLFATCPMSEIPHDIKEIFSKEKIPWTDTDSIVVIGHGGPTMWEKIPKPLGPNPVDTFALNEVEKFNRDVLNDSSLRILYPKSQWLVPLQRLGRFLKLGQPSLLGLDINSQYGLWFAFRVAFLTSRPLPKISGPTDKSPCINCATKPCQTACPAQAVQSKPEDFRLNACAQYRFEENSKCEHWCHARAACPVGEAHRYTDEQFAYHMGRPAHLLKLKEYK